MKKAGIVLFSLYGFLAFILLLILLFPAFFMASFFGPIRGGNGFYRICHFWSDAWFFLIRVRSTIIHEAKAAEHRPCIFVANHHSYMDVPMIVNTIREPIRILGKQEMASIPLFGYVYRNAVVMVDRKSAADRAKSINDLKKTLDHGISIFIFPEGSFNETSHPLKSFYDGAFKIAMNTQTPIQPIIFPDSGKRLNQHSVFSLNPGICRAVYLPMVEIDAAAMNAETLKQTVFSQMEAALLRYQRS